jgi:hypothetical protein
MSSQRPCHHRTCAWSEPVEFALRPGIHTARRWRYAEVHETCTDCGQQLSAFRVDLRGVESFGKVYRVVFEGDRVREGNGYRLAADGEGPPAIVLRQYADLAGPAFDVDPPIPLTTIEAAFEDDYPFALVRGC